MPILNFFYEKIIVSLAGHSRISWVNNSFWVYEIPKIPYFCGLLTQFRTDF